MNHSESSELDSPGLPDIERRPFMIRFLAAVCGVVVGIVPLVAGGFAFLSPLMPKKDAKKEEEDEDTGRKILVTSLAAIPADGQPRRFPVIADRHDAWNYYPPAPIGSVYLRRLPDQEKPECFSATCPHLGCMVDFKANAQEFKCPCHNSFFTIDGARINPSHCPSPRDLDTLEVQLEGDEVYVIYERFRGGVEEKIAET